MTPIILPDPGNPVQEPVPVDPEEGEADEAEELELAQEDPLEGIEFDAPRNFSPKTADAVDQAPLMDLEKAVEQIPETLRKEMADLLRAEFREVIRWKPGKS